MKTLYSIIALSIVASSAHAGVLWDQGASTGNYGGSWANWTSWQNFLDPVRFDAPTTVTSYTYYTDFDPSYFGTLNVKLFSNSGNTPGSAIAVEDVAVSSYAPTQTANGVNVYAVELVLSNPWQLDGNTTYWVGASGNGFEAAQISLLSPHDGKMAQLDGPNYSFMTSVGDQAFRLNGTGGNAISTEAVPEPASMVALGLGLAGALKRRKK